MSTQFMQQKYSYNSLLTHYREEISLLRTPGITPGDNTKIQIYAEAANTLKQMTIKDIVQLIFTYARGIHLSNPFKESILIIIGYRITRATEVDVAYLKLLLAYTMAFKVTRMNLKDWTLKFMLSSSFSPFKPLIDHEIDRVINDTKEKLRRLS